MPRTLWVLRLTRGRIRSVPASEVLSRFNFLWSTVMRLAILPFASTMHRRSLSRKMFWNLSTDGGKSTSLSTKRSRVRSRLAMRVLKHVAPRLTLPAVTRVRLNRRSQLVVVLRFLRVRRLRRDLTTVLPTAFRVRRKL